MAGNITLDNDRFRKIIKKNVRENFKQYIKNHDLVVREGDKTVRVPIDSLELPRLIHDPNKKHHVSQGPGEVGDALFDGDGEENEGGEGSKPGDKEGKHAYDVELEISELAEMFGEALSLPELKRKKVSSTLTVLSRKYSTVSKHGAIGLRIARKSFKRALLRTISMHEYDIKNPVIIPRKEDFIYKHPRDTMQPQEQAVIFYLMDVSGSMTNEKRDIVKTMCFWIELWLEHSYKQKLTAHHIVHDTTAHEITKERFYKINTSGGTILSSAIITAYDIINKKYLPIDDWNIYIFAFSDGDNWSEDDNIKTVNIIKELISYDVHYAYSEIATSESNESAFVGELQRQLRKDEHIRVTHIASREQIVRAIKVLFSEKTNK